MIYFLLKELTHLQKLNMSDKTKAVLIRFAKGAIAGAVTSMAIVSVKQPQVWTDVLGMLNALGLAGVYGAIVGLLLALQKWTSWSDTV